MKKEYNENPELFLNGLEYAYYILLVEYHFDVFGLIEKGIAIDINTLDKWKNWTLNHFLIATSRPPNIGKTVAIINWIAWSSNVNHP